MKGMKSLLLLLLVFVFVLTTACGSNGGNSNSSDDENTNSSNKGNNSNQEGNSSNEEKLEKLSLEFYFPGANDTVMPKGDVDFVKSTIEEKFNVELNMTVLPWGDERKTKLNLLISSGDAPDLAITNGSSAGELHDSGVLGDIGEYLNPEKMPNVYNWVTQEEIDIFQFDQDSVVRGPVPMKKFNDVSYFIRKDWLDNLGLKVPTNYEELTEVVRAFTEDDPDGNNNDDTYGFSADGSGQRVSFYIPQYKNHGMTGLYSVDPDTKDFTTFFAHENTAAAVDDFRVWLDNGYVDPDWYLSKRSDVANKFSIGKVGMMWGGAPSFMDSNPNSIYNQLKELDPDAEVIPFNPFPDKPNWTGNAMSTNWWISQSTAENSPEKVKRITQIVDWLQSEEGFLLTHYGIEGKHYTRDGDTITTDPEAFNKDIIEKGNFLEAYISLTPPPLDGRQLGLTVVIPTVTDRDREILDTIAGYEFITGLGTSVSSPESVDFGSWSAKRYEIQVLYLFEHDKYPDFDPLLKEFLVEYKANDMFEAYTEQMQAAGIEVNDWVSPLE